MFANIKQRFVSRKLPSAKGEFYERKAQAYLKQQGFQLILTNYYCRLGEIDIIAQDGETLVFIEVRYRKKMHYGAPVITVDFRKQKKIRLTAQHFLQKYGLTNRMPCRFDVVGITGNTNDLDFQWIRNAF